MNLLHCHKILAMSCLVTLLVGFFTNFYYLSNHKVYAKVDEYELGKWQGKIEEGFKAGQERDQAIFLQIKVIRDKIDGISDNITDIKVQAAKNAGIYGGGSGAGIFLVLTLIKILVAKKNNKNKNGNA